MLRPDLANYHNSDIIFKNLTIEGFGLDNWLSSALANEKAAMVEEFVNMISDPGLSLEVAGKYALEDYKAAMVKTRTKSCSAKVLFWNI